MKIVNITKGTIVARGYTRADTLVDKSIGLLGASAPKSLYFKTRFGIHTVGMQFPIDCAVLDEAMVVRAVRHNLTPGNFFFWNPLFRHVIELPSGALQSAETAVGDALAFA